MHGFLLQIDGLTWKLFWASVVMTSPNGHKIRLTGRSRKMFAPAWE